MIAFSEVVSFIIVSYNVLLLLRPRVQDSVGATNGRQQVKIDRNVKLGGGPRGKKNSHTRTASERDEGREDSANRDVYGDEDGMIDKDL